MCAGGSDGEKKGDEGREDRGKKERQGLII